jgi:CRP/FNR family cyclic AMP-dependent transcriptional regulator
VTAASIDRTVGFVDRLEPDVRDELLALGRRRRFTTQATLLYEGDQPVDVVVVRDGVVKVSTNIDGREVVLDILGAGDIAGELAALDGRLRSASVVAMTPAEVHIIPTAAFMAFLAARPEVAMTLLRCVSTRLRDASRRQVEYGALDAVGRVCRRLVELMERYGQPVGAAVRIDAPLTQSDIAAWAGLSREAVVKALQSLRRLGWVATTPRGISVLDVAAVTTRASVT